MRITASLLYWRYLLLLLLLFPTETSPHQYSRVKRFINIMLIFPSCDRDIWPLTLTYDLDLDMVTLYRRARYLDQSAFSSTVIMRTNAHTHTHNWRLIDTTTKVDGKTMAIALERYSQAECRCVRPNQHRQTVTTKRNFIFFVHHQSGPCCGDRTVTWPEWQYVIFAALINTRYTTLISRRPRSSTPAEHRPFTTVMGWILTEKNKQSVRTFSTPCVYW